MKALIREAAGVRLAEIDPPALMHADDVIVRVVVAGLCRTDLYVAEGRLPVTPPRVLGHELAGTVCDAGPDAADLAPGDRVTVMPAVPCEQCPSCRGGLGHQCARTEMLGVDRDGAFAELVRVPAAVVHRVPDRLPWTWAAYSEPIAATLAIFDAGLRAGDRILVHGSGRIATLCARLLAARGHPQVMSADMLGGPPPADAFDVVIDCGLDDERLAEMIAAARPGGTIVLKSRRPEPVTLVPRELVRKRLVVRAVGYGDITEAIAVLGAGRLPLDDLLGPCFALEDFAAAFATARRDEQRKVFLRPDPP